MDQTYKHVTAEFKIPATLFSDNNLRLDLKKLYYYIGYSKSLKDNNIQYNMSLTEIEIFGKQFQRLYDYILYERIDFNVLYIYEKELILLIEDTIYTHNLSKISSVIRKGF